MAGRCAHANENLQLIFIGLLSGILFVARKNRMTHRMKGLCWLVVLWVLCAGAETQNWSQNKVQQTNQQVAGNRQPPFKSWNSRMYPIWRGSEAQKKNCWKGGQVTFDLVNDAPTLTGAKATFSIQLNFPKNQTVLPDGQVVWSQNRTDNGTWVPSGEPIYPDESTEGSECTFPDGRPFPRGVEKKHSKFVYVWQMWGKYWQVVDGPSSNLTVETDGIPLGSYTMQVVVYHYRGSQKFIPIGSASSQFTITDQIPVSVSISQLLDLDQEDQRFIQNRAVSFAVAIHDPSHYLQAADISFSWDFGDQSGTLITRNTDVTHTYVSTGVFTPKVVLQAAIPTTPCGSTVPTADSVPTTVIPPQPTTTAASTSGGQVTAALPGTTAALPGTTAALPGTTAALPSNVTQPQGTINGIVVTVPPDVEEQNNLVAEATVSASAVPDNEAATLPEAMEGEAVVTVAGGENVLVEEEAEPNQAQTVTVEEAVPTQETAAEAAPSQEAVTVEEAVPTQEAEALTSEAENTEAGAEVAEGSPSVASEINEMPSSTAEILTVPATEEVVVIAKRQAPEDPFVGCLLYRFGTFATDLDIVQGIESAQIVQVAPVAAVDGAENAVDLTITCQGSVPSQVCTIISDADCATPQETICNTVQPSTDCQLVLRQVFNETGLYCVNVSLTDSVSLAMASTQVSVSGAGSSFTNGGIVLVGVLLAMFAVVIVAYTYRKNKSYTALRTAQSPTNWFPDRLSLRLFFQNALGLSRSGENSPLLNGRVV